MKRTGFKRKLKVKKVKKPKKLTTSQLKKKLDAIFSIYIRKKYEKNGYIRCYTCSAQKLFGDIQCGHFVSRSYLATRFEEKNCRPQCVGCNIFGGGKTVMFANLLEIESEGIVKQLYIQAKQIIKDFPYQEKIEYYQQKIKELCVKADL